MKLSTQLCFILGLSGAVLAAGCSSSPKSRISKNQAAFDSYPAEVQAGIREGRVEVGYTSEQTRLALGAPDRVLTRTSGSGNSEVWVYRSKSPRLGVGLGLGVGSGPVGGGVGVSSSGREFADERLRVVFAAGRVTSVEQVTK
ncbi:MAG: hypothetical protein ABW223_09625 [Rariglobus sp.]